jgi:predicted dehydrogenase
MAAEKRKSERELEIGLIGCGGIVEGLHLPALTSIPGAKIKWVCDASADRARRVARDWNIRKPYTQLCDCDDVDAVLIATPVGTRREILDQTTKRGWHAFCEKPFATSTQEHHDLLRNARDKGRLILGAGYMRRYYWAVEKARQILRSSALGSLIEVVASESAQLDRTGINQSSYRNSAQASGGGVLVETGCHLLDQVIFLTDCDEFEVESCEQEISNGYEVETVAWGFLKRGSGAEVSFQFTVSGVEAVFQGIALRCESGEIRLRLDPERALEISIGKENPYLLEIRPTFPRHNHAFEAFRSEWLHFLAQIREPGNWDAQRETGLLTTEAIMKCRELASNSFLMVRQ